MAAEGGCPHTMKWMPDTDFIENNPDKLEMFNPDLIICLDCEFNERTGYIYKIFKDRIDSETQIAVIDHHKGTSGIGNMRIVIPEAASTTEIIYNFFKINGIEINNKTALSMYVGILTDTYMFCQANTSSSVLKAASELITFSSVDPYALTQKLFENKTYEQSKLLARFLENIIIDTDNAIGYSYLENKDFDETGTEHDDTEGFINYIRAIKNVKIALFFKEISADFIKVNIRTVGDIDILPYVKKYGGGGHKNAAGFEIKDKLTPELITEYLDSLKKEIVK
jgi:phosphoesterase RecJ-like protein